MKRLTFLVCFSFIALMPMFSEGTHAFNTTIYKKLSTKSEISTISQEPLFKKFKKHYTEPRKVKIEVLNRFLTKKTDNKKNSKDLKQKLLFAKMIQKKELDNTYILKKLDGFSSKNNKTEKETKRFDVFSYSKIKEDSDKVSKSFFTEKQINSLTEQKTAKFHKENSLLAENIKKAVEDEKTKHKEVETKKESKEQGLTFSLSILPVRFVYLDKKGNIIKIWNNVKQGDDIYVLKFFDLEEDTELEESSLLVSKYFDTLKNLNTFTQGYIYDTTEGANTKNQGSPFAISITHTKEGTREIYTYM